jgi:hypothetical protein
LDIGFLPNWYRKQEYPLVQTTASLLPVDTCMATQVYRALLTGVNRAGTFFLRGAGCATGAGWQARRLRRLATGAQFAKLPHKRRFHAIAKLALG